MIGHALLDAQAEGAQLARRPVDALRVDPAAGVAVAPLGGDAVAPRGIGHGQLQGTHERPQQQPGIRQPDDGIRHQLSGTVIGHLAAALHPERLDAARGEHLVRGTDVGRVGITSEGQHRVVLQQQQRVGRVARGTRGDQGVLPVPGVLVPDPAQPLASKVHGRTIAGGAATPRVCGTGGCTPLVVVH